MSATWDERYGTEAFYYGTDPNDFLVEHAAAIPRGGDVLCLAEGEGRNAVYLAGQGYHVTAIDQSAVGLQKAIRLAQDLGVGISTTVADLATHRIQPQRWDAVVSIWCHLPSKLRATVHAQVFEALRPGGVLILEAYTPDQLKHKTGGPPAADLMPTLAQLRTELLGLEFEHAVEKERIIHEGKGHSGLSAVVQIVARKAP